MLCLSYSRCRWCDGLSDPVQNAYSDSNQLRVQMEILLRKSDQFDELMEAAATEDFETGEDLDS